MWQRILSVDPVGIVITAAIATVAFKATNGAIDLAADQTARLIVGFKGKVADKVAKAISN